MLWRVSVIIVVVKMKQCFKVCHARCVVKLMVGRVITVSNTTRSF
jgi:hypothetical protein